MVLPVNTESTIDAIGKMSQVNVNEAQASLINTENKQKMAEYQTYISDTQKQLREAKAQSDISQANAQKLQTDVINQNPDLYTQNQLSGVHAQLQQHMAAQGQAYNEGITTVFGGDGVKDAADYEAKIVKANQMGMTDLLKGLPSVQEFQSNPDKYQPMVNQMVSTAWQNNASYQQQKAEAAVKYTTEMQKAQYEGGIHLKVAEIGANTRQNVAYTNAGARTDAASIVADSRRDVAQINAAAKLQAVKERQAGGSMSLNKELGTGGTVALVRTMAPDIGAQIDAVGLSLNKDEKNAILSRAVDMAAADWQKEADQFNQHKSDVAPDHVRDLVPKYVNMILNDPTQFKETLFGGKDYKPAAVDPVQKVLSPDQWNQYKGASPEVQAKIKAKLGIK